MRLFLPNLIDLIEYCLTLPISTFTTVADNQQTVQFPIYQGERINVGEFSYLLCDQ